MRLGVQVLESARALFVFRFWAIAFLSSAFCLEMLHILLPVLIILILASYDIQTCNAAHNWDFVRTVYSLQFRRKCM